MRQSLVQKVLLRRGFYGDVRSGSLLEGSLAHVTSLSLKRRGDSEAGDWGRAVITISL